MVDNPQQDRDAGLLREVLNGRFVTRYEPSVALAIVERIADGELLVDICKPGQGMPTRQTFNRWVLQNGELSRAYYAARELSAQALEEEALGLANALTSEPATTAKVAAYNAAMNQYRWSAARRDPGKYGDKTVVNIKVPVSITTSLDLGQPNAPKAAREEDIYSFTAHPEREVIDGDFSEVPGADAPVEVNDPTRNKPKIGLSKKGKLKLTPRLPMDAYAKTERIKRNARKSPVQGRKQGTIQEEGKS